MINGRGNTVEDDKGPGNTCFSREGGVAVVLG